MARWWSSSNCLNWLSVCSVQHVPPTPKRPGCLTVQVHRFQDQGYTKGCTRLSLLLSTHIVFFSGSLADLHPMYGLAQSNCKK
eukprot:1152970-Pelagomonas_calceolata.AAC.3